MNRFYKNFEDMRELRLAILMAKVLLRNRDLCDFVRGIRSERIRVDTAATRGEYGRDANCRNAPRMFSF